MSTVLALELLYEDVVARFAEERPGIEQPFGWREPQKRLAGRRIVWVPGDDDDVGEIGTPTKPGRNPRPLYTLDELCTIYVKGYDTTQPENERAQWRACRLLLDDVLRALYLSAHTRVSMRGLRWVNDKNERRAGAAVRLVIAIESMVPDADVDTSTTNSATTLSLLDASDAIVTEEP
jgi:hypothetical protein